MKYLLTRDGKGNGTEEDVMSAEDYLKQFSK